MRPKKERGFMTYRRALPPNEKPSERLKHYCEFTSIPTEEAMRDQGYRCMNCGVPFCQFGCPLGNIIPDFNDFVKDADWVAALERLHSTNNFPEVTGRVCPAPCESCCVLGINEPPVTIKLIERTIVDRAWDEGRVKPEPPQVETGKAVAVVGSGPAGLAAAQQLRRAGHKVTVYERADEPGGLLVYGIPDFKMEKENVRRRVEQMRQEGVVFVCGTEVGKDCSAKELLEGSDAVLLTVGATKARDIEVPGRELDGIHLAMDFLPQQNRRVAGKPVSAPEILATGKRVVVLGGGDTGSDCIGTSLRQGAASVQTFELLPKPPEGFNPQTPWPTTRPMILTTSTSHQEGGERDWSVLTKGFSGAQGRVTTLHAARIEWIDNPAPGAAAFREIPGSDFAYPCDLVLLALGFLHPEHLLAEALGLALDPRGNFKAGYGARTAYRTNVPKVYAAGDARRGQSLVVWAIHEGREAARTIDLDLMGYSDLPGAYNHGYDEVSV